ncbi:SPOR domain-containing protein [Photobacterium japonica]|uniref:SPOR domain-containing protein n=1 Tax=Photobacterium japonica TaxID=2910235 RepID=UPI003D0A73E3
MYDMFRPIAFACLLLAGLPMHASASSDKPRCATTPHASGWTLLDNTCDVGQGLWGRKPKTEDGAFWVQCNYSKAIPDQAFLRSVQQVFPTSHYLLNDDGHYRCVVGPLNSYPHAQEVREILLQHGIRNAFIRQQRDGKTRNTALSAAEQLAATKMATINATRKTAATTAQPTPATKLLIENRTVLDAAIYSFTFENLNFYQPRTIQSTREMPLAFVEEHQQYWSRVPLNEAQQWCNRYGLRLPSFDELKHLQTYGQRFLLRNHWPITHSYWSQSVSHYSGEIQTLNVRNGRVDEYRPLALLYTTCVQEAS